MNAKLINHIVIPFMSNDFSNAQYIGAYFSNKEGITIHNELTIFKVKDLIYIQLKGNLHLTVDLLNCFVGLNANIKDGKIFINSIEWDGLKTNINLFT
jgi:hypothetical protein